MAIDMKRLEAEANRAVSGFEVRQDPDEYQRSRDADKSFDFIYWRNTATGWIDTGPGWGTEYEVFFDSGYLPASQTWHAEDGRVLPGVNFGKFKPYDAATGWNIHHEPWRRIFQQGRADVFTVEQIIALNWHRRAPYPGVEFPQLVAAYPDGVPDFACGSCPRHFNSHEDLVRHETVVHQEASRNTQLGRSIAGENAKVTGPLGEMLGGMVQMMAQTQEANAAMLAQLQAANAQTQQVQIAILERLAKGDAADAPPRSPARPQGGR